MSADDFQTKYASVMESMLKSAIAETTKLFETMVDDLKAEISRIKKENEDLRTRCSQFENGKSHPTASSGESEPLPPPSNGSGKRDTAVQCDLAPFHTVLVGQCQPLKNSLLQNQQQQCHYEEMEYGLPLINQESLPGEMPEKDGETRVAIEQPYFGMESDLQGAQNQSSEPEHSLVISFSAIKDDTKETEGELVTSEEQPTTKEQPSVVPQQRQREGVESVNEQTVVTLQQYADVHCTGEQVADPTPQNKERVEHVELKNGTTEDEASFQPTRRKRGRPPKKGKRLKKPVKEIIETSSTDVTAEQEMVNSPSVEEVEEVVVFSAVNTVNTTASESSQAFPVECKKISSIIIPSVQESTSTALGDVENCEVGSLLVSVASLTRSCSSENEKSSESKQLSTEMEAPSTEVSSATAMPNSPPAESPQAPPVQLRAHDTFVTLQNAMLMVEAMNQSTGENTVSTPKRTAAPSQNQCAPPVGTLKIVDEVPTKPQTLQLPTETLEAAGSPPITELSTTQSTVKTLGAIPQVPDSTSTKEAQALIKVVIPKRQYAVTPSNTVTPPMPLSAATTQTSAQSQLRLPQPLITSVAPSKPTNAVPPKISVVPRSVPSFMTHKIAALSQTQLSTFVSTVAAAPNNSLLPASTAAGLPLGMPSSSSVPQKTIYVASRKSFPVVHRQLSNKSTDQHSGILPPPKITIIIPRQVSAVASRTHQPQTIVLTTKQESAEPAADVKVSSSPLCSSSTVSVGAQATSDVATISPKKRNNATDSLESPEQSASVCETTNAETSSGLKMSVPAGPLPASLYAVDQKLSAMVRLTRLPLSVSTKESVLVSRVLSNGCSETQSVVKEGTTHEKLSSVVISTQPSEMPVVSTDICPSLKETYVSVNTPQMSEKQNNIQETALLSSGKNAIYVQSFTPPRVSSPILEKPAVAISTAEPSAGEPASSLEEEIIRNAVQVCELPADPTTEEKQSPAVIQLTSIMSKDTSDPHLQMSKIQFLAQLAVSPIVQAPEEASSSDSAHTRACSAETSNSGKKGLQENSLVARLQGHLKAHLQTRRTEPNPEPCVETETASVSTKKLRLDNHSPNDRNTASEPVLISLKKSGVAEDVTSSNKTTNGPIPYSPKSIGLCKGTGRSKRSVSETRRSSKATSESTPVSPKRPSSGRNGVNVKFTSFSIQRSCSTKDGASPKKTKNGASLKNKKSTSVSTKMTSLTRDCSKVKQTQSTFMSTKLSSFSPRRTKGSAVAKTQRETGSPSVRWPKLAKDGVSPGETGESTPAKKARLIHDVTSPKTNLRVLNAKKLAKAAKATTIAKMKNPTKLQNGAKSSNLAENQTSCEAEKKYTAKAVWIPPQMPTSKALSAGRKRSSLFLVKKETRSSRSQDHTASYPPSVSLHPIPVKAPPIVSPLQPLSVIGGRLLKNQCGECGRVLSSGAALESHVSLHTGCRPFSCTLCGKSFPDAKGLKRHGRVHRNGRIHVCQQCGKGFVYRFGLTKHLQMVHSRLKPFVCQICNKGFFTKRDVEAHIRIHTGEKPFHCNLCDKKFTRRVELNVHLRWHNGEKRHWCPYCGKGFLDFNNLKRHKYIHTGEKPHSCPHCPKHFTQSGHLKKHVKNVHKIQ